MIRRLATLAALLFVSTATAQAQFVETRFAALSFTVSTSPAYTAGDAIGTKGTLTNACLSRSNRGEVRGVTINDLASQSADIDLVLFNADPTATTFTDNAALDIADADLSKITAVIPVTTHKTFADNSISQAKNIAYPFQCNSSGTLYYALVARGTPTYAATTDVSGILEFIND